MEITLAKIKETKNTVRFGELDSDGNPAEYADQVVGTVYVKKDAVANELGGAERITVTINGA